jgi:hypothetical protein
MTPIYDLPISKLLIIIKKLYRDLFVNENNFFLISYGTEKVNQELRIFGYDYVSIKEYSFIVEFMRLNNENLKSNTLNKENVVLPELKKVQLEHKREEIDTVEKIWSTEAETFSTEKSVCYHFFDGDYNRASDAIDIFNTDPDYEKIKNTDVGDTKTSIKVI